MEARCGQESKKPVDQNYTLPGIAVPSVTRTQARWDTRVHLLCDGKTDLSKEFVLGALAPIESPLHPAALRQHFCQSSKHHHQGHPCSFQLRSLQGCDVLPSSE